jgi:hypothetical protein
MDNSSSSTSSALDQVAVGLSGLCLAHCLLLPLIIAVVPFFGHLGSGHFHLQMLAFVLPISAIALALGYRRHRQRAIIAWGTLGMLLLVVGGTLMHKNFGLTADRLFTIAGALTLAVVHYFNNRLTRHCRN